MAGTEDRYYINPFPPNYIYIWRLAVRYDIYTVCPKSSVNGTRKKKKIQT
jgi:hypothetical protein